MQIYKTTNLINGKIYIGQDSKNNPKYFGSGKYLKNALDKYGIENFKKEILENNIKTIDQLNEREIFWIKEFNSMIPNGYNLNQGGGGQLGYHMNEYSKEKMREKLSKNVYQYDLNGNFIQKHRSIKEASKCIKIDSACITACCKKKLRLAGGFVWSYQLIDKSERLLLKEEFLKIPYVNNFQKNVYQYDLNGNFIQKYKSITEAAVLNNVNINSIIGNCKGRRITGAGYIWSYIELSNNKLSMILNNIKNNKHCKITEQYNLDGKLIKEYESAKLAANETNINYGSISQCCKGKLNHAGGFVWKYKKVKNVKIECNQTKKHRYSNSKQVYQYDLDGNLLNHFYSANEAMRITGVNQSSINGCCNGNRQTSNNYIWSYEILDINQLKEIIYNKQNNKNKGLPKEVLQYDKDNNFIKEYKSQADAANSLNISRSNITNCCLGKLNHTGGFIWKYKK